MCVCMRAFVCEGCISVVMRSFVGECKCCRILLFSFLIAGSYFIARGSAVDVSHARVLLTSDTQFLVFQLSGEYVKVVISSSELTDSDDSYTVVFHGYARRVTLERNGQVLQSGDHDGAITTSRLHDVWVSWYDAEIVVGVSKSIGEQVLLRHQGDTQYTAKSIAVSAHNKSNVEWKCSTQLGKTSNTVMPQKLYDLRQYSV